MNIHTLAETDLLWPSVADFAETCSWDACARMATFMREGALNEWQRVFVAEEQGDYLGFCALVKSQDFPGLAYNPLIKWLFVGEKYRGKRLSEKLLETAAGYAKEMGYDKIFLTTWHIGLYEKYRFEKIFEKEVRDGYIESVYKKEL